MKRVTILLGLALLLLLTGAVLANGPTTIERYVLAGGGGRDQMSPDVILEATLGQPVVGLDRYAAYELCSGFRCRAVYKVHLPLLLRDYP